MLVSFYILEHTRRKVPRVAKKPIVIPVIRVFYAMMVLAVIIRAALVDRLYPFKMTFEVFGLQSWLEDHNVA